LLLVFPSPLDLLGNFWLVIGAKNAIKNSTGMNINEYMPTFICRHSKFNLLQNKSTYDDERHFKRMAAAGVFDSVKPDAKPPQWLVAYEKEVDAAIAALNKKK
jgi:hypothetical protein